MNKQELLTHAYLKSILDYDPNTGSFTWRRCTGYNKKNRDGTRAGAHDEMGYTRIQINRRKYYAHRLAWFWMMGCWPTGLDHKDGERSNNTWSNLRIADQSQNTANQKAKVRNLPKGVIKVKNKNKPYHAYITIRYKHLFLGSFSTAEEAVVAYAAAAKCYFGEFARTA